VNIQIITTIPMGVGGGEAKIEFPYLQHIAQINDELVMA
jgi:hypothetical protein